MKNKKRAFIEAVRLLAPGNEFILNTARLVREEDLPPIPGVAAFELAATLATLQKSWRFRQPLRGCPRARKEQQAPTSESFPSGRGKEQAAAA